MTIYRGYTIKPTDDGRFGIHSGGSHRVVSETFATEDEAMTAIDAERRQQFANAQSNSEIG